MPTAAVASPMPPAILKAVLAAEGAGTVVRLRGEADIATVAFIVDTLAGVIAERDGDVVVDLAETAFIDTAALRAIVRARGVLAGEGRALTLRSPSHIAARLLEVFGLSDLVETGTVVPMAVTEGAA